MARREMSDEPEPQVTDPTWREWRQIGVAGFGGIILIEDQVITAPTAPSVDSEQVPDGTPLHGWQPSRQWHAGAGPDGVTIGG